MVVRLFRVRPSVSITPDGSTKACLTGKLFSRLLVTDSPGDQVTSRAMSIGLGDTESDGSCIDTLRSERFCRRLPPRATVPQAKRLEKLAALRICWVDCSGSIALRR